MCVGDRSSVGRTRGRHPGRWQRLKVCHDTSCRRLFYDASRNRLGKWCSRRCGNVANLRNYRRRGGPTYLRP